MQSALVRFQILSTTSFYDAVDFTSTHWLQEVGPLLFVHRLWHQRYWSEKGCSDPPKNGCKKQQSHWRLSAYLNGTKLSSCFMKISRWTTMNFFVTSAENRITWSPSALTFNLFRWNGSLAPKIIFVFDIICRLDVWWKWQIVLNNTPTHHTACLPGLFLLLQQKLFGTQRCIFVNLVPVCWFQLPSLLN